MLLEWEIALDKQKNGDAYVLPVFIGRKLSMTDENGDLMEVYRPFLDEFGKKKLMERLPEEMSAHRLSPRTRKIGHTINTLMTLQAVFRGPDDFEDIARDAREVYQRRIMEAQEQIKRTETKLMAIGAAMKRITDALHPLDFTDERKRLRKAHQKGTRIWLLDEVSKWLHDETSRVFWLKGAPGVGKSVVAGMVANELQSGLHLGAAFFCKHDDINKKDAKKLIHTIANGLAHWDHRIALRLDQILTETPDITARSVSQQFNLLVRDPLRAVDKAKSMVVIVVDALDECGEENRRGDILNVLAKECASLPSFVKIVVTSRMENDIVKAFAKLEPYRLLDPTEQSNMEDIGLKANAILESLGIHLDSEENLEKTMVDKSRGLFTWLIMAEPYLMQAADVEDLRQRLAEIPVHVDGLYEKTLRDAYRRYPELRDIVTVIIMSQEPLSTRAIAGLLRLPIHSIKAALKAISGIIKGGEIATVRHKSVTDYLINRDLCKDELWHVDATQGQMFLATKCLQTLNEFLQPNLCNISVHQLNADIPDLPDRIEQDVPPAAIYPAEFWIDHVIALDQSEHLLPLIRDFLTKKLLDWFEVLSVLGIVGTETRKVFQFQIWLKRRNVDQNLFSLAKDAWRFLQDFHVPISASAAHVRWSAFPFCPHHTELYRTYHAIPANQTLPAVYGDVDEEWSRCLRTLEGDAGTTMVALSGDGALIALCSVDKLNIWETDTGLISNTFEYEGRVRAVTVTDDMRVVVILTEGKVMEWDLTTGALESTFNAHTERIDSAVISEDGRFAAVGLMDGTAKVWTVAGTYISTLPGHTRPM
ncbi:hypothetical protein HDV00_007406 [Rhizophlyctis rosea]|nr:hypothetical protein HDV00_007406 [Rhizophlyctis rosea]